MYPSYIRHSRPSTRSQHSQHSHPSLDFFCIEYNIKNNYPFAQKIHTVTLTPTARSSTRPHHAPFRHHHAAEPDSRRRNKNKDTMLCRQIFLFFFCRIPPFLAIPSDGAFFFKLSKNWGRNFSFFGEESLYGMGARHRSTHQHKIYDWHDDVWTQFHQTESILYSLRHLFHSPSPGSRDIWWKLSPQRI